MTARSLSPAQREHLLREMWMDHDGRWFLKVAERNGFDEANELNRAASISVAKTGMRKLIAMLGEGRVRDVKHLRDLMELAYGLYYPPPICDVSFECVGERQIRATYRKCPVMDRIEKGGGMKNYTCGCPNAFQGWLAAVDMPGTVQIRRSVPAGAACCEVLVEISPAAPTSPD